MKKVFHFIMFSFVCSTIILAQNPSDIEIFNDTGNAQFILNTPQGHFTMGMVNQNGVLSPLATPGDAVFKMLGDNNIIFNLSTSGSSSNGSRKIFFGDEQFSKTLVVSNDGKVGIGTDIFNDGFDHRFFVKGGLKAERVRVELCAAGGWCDYVFAPDYELQPLHQIKQFIQKNEHLPNMPSEQDLEATGNLDVGEITVKQQEKIEELFLYVIKLNEELQGMQEKITKLEAENNQLKKQ